jgi:hypothetical protein
MAMRACERAEGANSVEIATRFLGLRRNASTDKQKKTGRVVHFENNSLREQQGYSTEDILWSVGIWSVILTLSPVTVFYLLMVA